MCYAPDAETFERLIRDADMNAGGLKKVNIAVGAYRLLDSPDILQRQLEICRMSAARGCVILDYSDIKRKLDNFF